MKASRQFLLGGWLLLLAGTARGQVAPAITGGPADYAAMAGRTAFFSVTASGTAPLSYQWRKDTVNLAGATNALLLLGNVQTNQAGSYSVVVTNSSGTATSSNATLTVSSVVPGTVVAWGAGGVGQSGTPHYGQTVVPTGLSGVTAIAVGWYHSVALKSDHTVIAWGAGGVGQSGFPHYGQSTVPPSLSGITAIAAGYNHSAALKSDGTVVAWGWNLSGQTSVPLGLNEVIAIAAGNDHTVALKSDGTVVAWGSNTYGQTTVPPGLSGVTAIAAGGVHTVALKNDGTVVAWGAGKTTINDLFEYGQSIVPAGLNEVTAIAAGGYHTVAVQSGGSAVGWGGNDYGQRTVPVGLSEVTSIAAGVYSTLALTSGGTVVAWGGNDYGQRTVPPGLSGVTGIAAGYYHSLAVTTNGLLPIKIVVDGVHVPNGSVVRPDQAMVTLLTAYTNFAIYYSTDGLAPFIGGPLTYTNVFTVTTNTTIRALAVNLDDFSSVASEPVSITIIPTYSLTLSTAGGGYVTRSPSAANYLSNSVVTVTATASNGWTFLYWTGDVTGTNATNSVTMSRAKTAQAVFGTTLATSVAGGGTGTVQLSPASGPYPYGSVVRLTPKPAVGSYFSLWGNAASGSSNPLDFTVTTPNRTVSALFTALSGSQVNVYVDVVGNGSVTRSPALNVYTAGQTVTLTAVPSVITRFDGWSGDSTATTNGISLLLEANKSVTASFSPVPVGTVVAWGAGRTSTGVDPEFGQSIVPAGLNGVTAIAGGYGHTVALKGDGTVVAWGFNNYGQTDVPAGLIGVTAIAARGDHTVALKSDGTVVAWGDDGFGQSRPPTGLTGVKGIAAGEYHTLALKSDGTVMAWGFNSYGQTNVPAGLIEVMAIMGGEQHSVALKSDGTVVAWGRNNKGQTNVPAGLIGVTAIAAGRQHSAALRNDGTVVVWGDNANGETVVPAGLSNVTAIAAGYHHTVALKSDGTLVAWGANNFGQTNVPAGLIGVTAIAAGYGHTVALIGDARGPVPPAILTQPFSQAVTAGSNVTFRVSAISSVSLGYQWRSNSVNVANATNAGFTLTNVQTSFAASYSVVITNAYGASTSSPAVLTVQLGQSVSFGSLPDRTFGDPSFTLTATASSGLAVTNSVVSGPASLSGNSLTLLGAGTVTVRATQAGNATYAPASADQTFTVAKAEQTITFAALPDKGLGDPPFNLSATASSSLPVGFSLQSGPASLSGSTLTLNNGGVVLVRALQAGNTNYNAAPNVDRSFTVFTNPPPLVSLTSPLHRQSFRTGVALTLSASASDPGGAVTNVEFYANNLRVGAVAVSPYTLSWTPPAAGLYTLRAEALDNGGARGVSTNLQIAVQDQAPLASLLSPTNGSTFSLPTNILLTARATDLDGFDTLVARVEFLDYGTNVIGTVNTPTNTTVSFVWTNPPPGQHSLSVRATDAVGLVYVSAANLITVNYPAGTVPVFSFAQATYAVGEADGSVVLTVLKNQSPAGVVNYTTVDGTARAQNGATPGDYVSQAGSLSFAAGELQKTVSIAIINDDFYEGDQSFTVVLSAPGAGVVVTNPAVATVTIVDNDPRPTTDSVIARNPDALPPLGALGMLQVHTLSTNVPVIGTTNIGQWRLRWDTVWHNSGDVLSKLEPGGYEVVFQPRDGFVTPGDFGVTVSAGATTVTNAYYSSTGTLQTGSLLVSLTPAGAQWRLQGETAWRAAGVTVSNLMGGPYVLEFNELTGYLRPAPVAIGVFTNFTAVLNFTYPATPETWGLNLVLFDELQNAPSTTGEPYAFNGQILSEGGYGTGTVVKPRVVLTAGHMVFNDRTLTFVTNVYWFPRRYAGQFEPRPVQPRGWYVFAGYDAQRAVDNSPGVSSPAAQQLDAAALFFYQNAVAGGGQSGYLVSDATTNWLTGSEAKRLTGYPLDAPAPLDRQRKLQSFGLFTSPLAAVAGAPGVFTTGAFRSTGGNSGGALNVRFNNIVFYPAGIYLGGTGQSVVRVIDRDVVGLINRAELTANTGDNNSSGGVPTGSGEGNQLPLFGGLFGTGGLAVRLDAAAVAAGAGWRFVRPGGSGDSYIRDNSLVTNRVTGLQTNLLEFTGVAGYLTPGRVSAPVLANTTQTVSVVYARALSNQVPRLLSGGQFRFDVSASSYGRYVVYGRTDLRTGTWVPLVTNTLDALGQHGFTNAPGTPFHFFYTGYLTNP